MIRLLHRSSEMVGTIALPFMYSNNKQKRQRYFYLYACLFYLLPFIKIFLNLRPTLIFSLFVLRNIPGPRSPSSGIKFAYRMYLLYFFQYCYILIPYMI